MSELFNKKVLSVEPIQRDKDWGKPGSGNWLGIPHGGALLTIEGGGQFVAHAVKDKKWVGSSGNHVVLTSSSNLSERWQNAGPVYIPSERTTVGDVMKIAGKNYNWRTDNCLHKLERMCPTVKNSGYKVVPR